MLSEDGDTQKQIQLESLLVEQGMHYHTNSGQSQLKKKEEEKTLPGLESEKCLLNTKVYNLCCEDDF